MRICRITRRERERKREVKIRQRSAEKAKWKKDKQKRRPNHQRPVPSRRIKWINWSKMVRQRGTKSPVTVSKVIISDEGQGRGKTKQQNFQGEGQFQGQEIKITRAV